MRAGCPRYTLPISASSTLPRTYTSLVSPSVITSVACEPRTRIELTASPTSTSFESTTPFIGLVIVEYRRFSSALSSAALACATCAFDCATCALLICTVAHRGRLPVQPQLIILFRVLHHVERDQPLLVQIVRPVHVVLQERHVGTFRIHEILLIRGFGGLLRGLRRFQVGARFGDAGLQLLFIEVGEHLSGLSPCLRRPGRFFRRCRWPSISLPLW